jgi:hypothetical protein
VDIEADEEITMLRITGDEVSRALQGHADRFTAFVDALIRAEAHLGGVPDAAVITNQRYSIPDGGVDTECGQEVLSDRSGALRARSVWQYKAMKRGDIRIPTLFDGSHVRERVKQGYAFRLAVAGEFPADVVARMQESISQEIAKFCQGAPDPLVLNASALAAWTKGLPAIVLEFLRPPDLQFQAIHLEAWARTARNITRRFVEPANWSAIASAIGRHVDFSSGVGDIVLPLQGEPGVGKTRLALEALDRIPGARELVLYTDDGEAGSRIARWLMNDPFVRGILVVDECSLASRRSLQALIAAEAARLRVITIDTADTQLSTQAPQYSVPKMAQATLEEVLEQNFPDVPPDRRRLYAGVADGYPAFAADLCRNHDRVVAAGGFGPVMPSVEEYLRYRLTAEEVDVVTAVSLVGSLGFKDEAEHELQGLCGLLGLPGSALRKAGQQLHEQSGFIRLRGRYFYVTPPVVAQAAFGMAWQRWAAHDPVAFLEGFPSELLDQLLKSVARYAPEEVRRICGDYFRQWIHQLGSEKLQDPATVDRVVALVDTNPTTFLPAVRRLVEAADIHTLASVTGNSVGGRWGPRRHVVWMCERFLRLPETYDDAERILLRLALAESEPNVANNATGIWLQSYRIYLSGTPVPFLERLHRLETYLQHENQAVGSLAIHALERALQPHGSRMVGDPVVAGRIPPDEWRPRSRKEEQEAFRASVGLLLRTAEKEDNPLSRQAVEVIVEHARLLLATGFLDALNAVLPLARRSSTLLPRLIDQVDIYLKHDVPSEHGHYHTAVMEWAATLVPDDLHSQLVATLATSRWSESRILREGEWQRKVGELAARLFADRQALANEFQWLFSAEAISAPELGVEMGRLDEHFTLLEPMVREACAKPAHGFANGYVHGLLVTHPTAADRVAAVIDAHESECPAVITELALVGGEALRPLERVLRLFNTGRINARFLNFWNFRRGTDAVDAAVIKPLLAALVVAGEQGDEVAAATALEAAGTELTRAGEAPWLNDPEVRDLLWRVVEFSGMGRDGHLWSRIITALARHDAGRAARVGARALVADDFGIHDDAERILTDLARSAPNDVMAALGEVMLDETQGWKFRVTGSRQIVMSLPVGAVKAWLHKVGVNGARQIARSLPVPHAGPNGELIVPELTEWVLREFENDDQTFREFCMGVHSFQVYVGDIAAQREAEANAARPFLQHPLRRIREWAEWEVRSGLAEAERERQEEEELGLR